MLKSYWNRRLAPSFIFYRISWLFQGYISKFTSFSQIIASKNDSARYIHRLKYFTEKYRKVNFNILRHSAKVICTVRIIMFTIAAKYFRLSRKNHDLEIWESFLQEITEHSAFFTTKASQLLHIIIFPTPEIRMSPRSPERDCFRFIQILIWKTRQFAQLEK